MTFGAGNNFNDFPEITPIGYKITKNNRLTDWGEMPGVGGRFVREGGFSPI